MTPEVRQARKARLRELIESVFVLDEDPDSQIDQWALMEGDGEFLTRISGTHVYSAVAFQYDYAQIQIGPAIFMDDVHAESTFEWEARREIKKTAEATADHLEETAARLRKRAEQLESV